MICFILYCIGDKQGCTEYSLRIFALVPNSGPNSVFVFGRIVSLERIRIVSLYSAASDVYGRLHSVSARCS